MKKRRDTKRERVLLDRLKQVVVGFSGNYPRNPADTELLFAYAVDSRKLHGSLVRAFSEIVNGPMFDGDYLEGLKDEVEVSELIASELTSKVDKIAEKRVFVKARQGG